MRIIIPELMDWYQGLGQLGAMEIIVTEQPVQTSSS
jgi:hypothetical protein